MNLDACSGCKSCVTACHALNGLDDDESWRDVGQLLGSDEPFQQTITTACHHCLDPACLNGCPVLAYEKDPRTGIVRHLDDQCIGCHYCVFQCPYEVPKYSTCRGIVRKCDLCHARLANGEAPACVQACPNGGISITFVRARDYGDGNTRQCMATAVAAYRESFGFDAPPYTYADLEESDVGVNQGHQATRTAQAIINLALLTGQIGRDAQSLLAKLEFLVVQDMYHSTETAQQAHLVFPAAGWGEKSGTFINSERRIGLTKKVAQAPGQALSDFSICQLVAEYWGCSDILRRWSTPEAVFQILKELSAGQPCDITGISDYQMLDQLGGVQWPPDAEFPLLLLTGRGTSAQWHTQTRTAKSAVLRRLYPAKPYAEIHPLDGRALGLRSGQRVQVRSRRGSIEVRALFTSIVARGQVFIPMHYVETNQLTYPAFDPQSRQPAYKACAVALRAAPKHK